MKPNSDHTELDREALRKRLNTLETLMREDEREFAALQATLNGAIDRADKLIRFPLLADCAPDGGLIARSRKKAA